MLPNHTTLPVSIIVGNTKYDTYNIFWSRDRFVGATWQLDSCSQMPYVDAMPFNMTVQREIRSIECGYFVWRSRIFKLILLLKMNEYSISDYFSEENRPHLS